MKEVDNIKNGEKSLIYDSKTINKLLDSFESIAKDVNRTFHNDLFVSGSGQLQLGRVLEATSYIKPEIGYCQGMNFIAGALICLTKSEEESFWIFLIFLNYFELTNIFTKVL